MDDERIVAGLHCGEVLADLTEHLDGRLSRARALRVDEHLQSCDACRGLSGQIAAVVRAMRELPEELLPADLETRLLDRLLEDPVPDG